MRFLIDTDVAIHLRDGQLAIAARVGAFPAAPLISVLSRVELEGGVYRGEHESGILRARLEVFLAMVQELPFRTEEAEVYGSIVRQCGYSRPRILDRMIAATAMTHALTLITINGDDFKSIPGLNLEVWSLSS